ncbi:MAG TPA: ABC transporter ATP-binding protein [Paralcaligenes sp.]
MSGITIKGLTKSYTEGKGGRAAVNNIDLAIEDHQFVTLLGPSGCGKTTTLRLIAGYLTPDEGTIHLGDREISSPHAVVSPDRRGMGMVFQNYAVWPHKTVRENVVFGLKVRKVAAARIADQLEKALALVNLTGLEDRFPNELSGGQQQRVALARSLVVEPEILLLDEPLSNLDAKLREHMRMELKQLQRRTGITFVYVTHDQAEALALSDRIAVMHGGVLQQFSAPHEVYTRPANKIVADFMGLVNFLPGTVVADGSGLAVSTFDDVLVSAALSFQSRAGDQVELAVRPENIQISPVGTGARSVGRIADVIYLGNLVEYMVEVSSGQVLRVQAHPKELFAVGSQVQVTLDADRCNVFAPDAKKA